MQRAPTIPLQAQQQQQQPINPLQIQQQQQEAEATRFELISRSLLLVNTIREDINNVLDNVAKSNSRLKTTLNLNNNEVEESSTSATNNESFEHSKFLKDTDVKYLQDKTIELNAKISELDGLIMNSLQPMQIHNNDFFNNLLDQHDEKSTLNASKTMYNYRWLKNVYDDKTSVVLSNLPYKRYQTSYMERKSPKFKIFKPFNRPDKFETSLNTYMNSPQHLGFSIKVTVIDITDKKLIIDIQMPQFFKFVLHLYDFIIETIQVKAVDPRTLTASDGYEDAERKIRLRLFEKLEENVMYASIYYKNTVENTFQAFKHLLNWLKQYVNLYNGKCSRCEKHLMNGLPPLWRDLKTYDIYHDECKL